MKKYLESYEELYSAVYEIPKKYKETNLADFVAMKGKRYNEACSICRAAVECQV